MTNKGLWRGAGAVFGAARTAVGLKTSSLVAQELLKDQVLMTPMRAATYIVEEAASASLGQTPLTNATMAGARAAATAVPEALAVSAANFVFVTTAFEGGILVGSVIEAGYHMRTCGRR